MAKRPHKSRLPKNSKSRSHAKRRSALVPLIPASYRELLSDLKARIRDAQVRAVLSVNRELIQLYWFIGQSIVQRQELEGWGKSVIERLATDLQREFSDVSGFSVRNLWRMRAFYRAYAGASQILPQAVAELPARPSARPVAAILPQAVAEIPWGHNIALLEKLERALLNHLRQFLLELGAGFALVGQQHHLVVGGEDFYVDLLFYHLKLRCFNVIDLKTVPFVPEHLGKMNFYLTVVDDQLRSDGDQPSIGLILCKSRNSVIVEYALRTTPMPVGVASYAQRRKLPKRLAASLPSIEQLQEELLRAEREVKS